MTAALALALALRLAEGEAATPLREVDEVKTASLDLTDGRHLDVVGGAYLSADSLLATGQELAKLRAENATLQAAPTPLSPPVAFVVGLVAGAALGACAVLYFRK